MSECHFLSAAHILPVAFLFLISKPSASSNTETDPGAVAAASLVSVIHKVAPLIPEWKPFMSETEERRLKRSLHG